MDPLYKDCCLPFQIEGQDIKGRVARLGKVLTTVFDQHDYPDAINRLLGEAMTLCALLGSMMKYEGILTVQIKSDGPVKTLVADYATSNITPSGVVRGYASFRDAEDGEPLLGKGSLMITMDQGKYMDRYQGIVALEGKSLSDAAENYFKSSEQLPSKVMLECDGKSAGGVLIQHLAGSPEVDPDDWQTTTILLDTLKRQELLDRKLSLQDMLMRLYHETGVRVYEPFTLENGCRCSEGKLRAVLSNFDQSELGEFAENGVITMTCEFCKSGHIFELDKLIN